MIIENFQGFRGEHCESTASLSILHYLGYDFSEPMFFGLGQGLGFIFWKMKIMNLPFIGGRSKPFELTRSFCRNMGIPLNEQETGSRKNGWLGLKNSIDGGEPVGLQLDCYYLDYFKNPIHFAGHFLCMYGYDNTNAYVVDTENQGSKMQTTLKSIEEARFAKGPMSAKARSWTMSKPNAMPALKTVIPGAINVVAAEFLNPPITNFGYKGILKLSKHIVSWLDEAPSPKEDLETSAMIMEKAGTGGGLFRRFYAEFLKESETYIPGSRSLSEGKDLYFSAADLWSEIASKILKAGQTGKLYYLEEASSLCKKTAEIEKKAMEILYNGISVE